MMDPAQSAIESHAPASDQNVPARVSEAERPRVVIVGAGFGGLSAARALARAPVDVVVIDRRNHHLFQPLLYQVATAALSPADIAVPARKLLRTQRNASVFLGEVRAVDLSRRTINVDGRDVRYDWLVLAAGASHSYFGRPEWERFAPGLKTLEDATEIRRRFLSAFERAETCEHDVERDAWLTFVIVGAGPTGVELAGAMIEIARAVLPQDFRRIDPARARVILIEGRERVLAAMSPAASRAAHEQLEELGVDVRVATLVTEVDGTGVVAGGARIDARTIVWAAGVEASPLGRSLGVELDRAGRVLVGPDLSVPAHPEVFVIGDQAAMRASAHVPDAWVPGVAQGALQSGAYVGRRIAQAVAGTPAVLPFVYRDKGNLATIGRKRAVADLKGRTFRGFAAWALWAIVHVAFLVQFRNRVFVLLGWLWSYVLFERGARLITGREAQSPPGR